MDRVQKMKQQKQYEKYVKTKTPVHNVWLNMIKAFFTGGMIVLSVKLSTITVSCKIFPKMIVAAGLLCFLF